MRRIVKLNLLVLLLFSAGCATVGSYFHGSSSHEKLVKKVLKSFQNADPDYFSSYCVVDEGFFSGALKFQSEREREMAYKFYSADALKSWRKVSRQALKEEIVWKNFDEKQLKSSQIKPHVDEYVDMAFSTLVYTFEHDDDTYKLVLKNCFRIKGRWFVKECELR